MKNLLLIIAALILASCNSKQQSKQNDAESSHNTYQLELLWESDTLLRTPESVLIDRKRDILYVSNINMGPWVKDGNGFISKMDKAGNILELKWIEGFSAPKGMGILGNSLFIADIDVLVEANIETGEIINKIEIEGNPELNDITVGEDGVVYVSGSATSKIYAVKDGTVELFFQGGEERFNGLFWEKERMLLITTTTSQFKEIGWETKEAKNISENMGHGDGIAPVGNGDYITTSWKGAIFYVSSEGETTKLLDTEELGENAADPDYSIEDEILYVPTFFKNQVKAYKLVRASS